MRLRISSDRGSIPAVLLTSIIVGGLIVVLVAAVLVNQRTARFDRSFTTVVQEADEYVQEAANNVIRSSWDPNRTDPPGTTYTIPGATTCPAVADPDVCLIATKVSSVRYEVEATAAARTQGDDVATRTVAANVIDLPRFFLAAFADTEITLRGGNAATSYGSGAWYTGNGIIASNEDIVLNGSSTVDGVYLYNWDNYPDYGRCRHSGGGNDCADVLADPPVEPSVRFGQRLEVGGTRLGTAFIDEAIAGCGTPLASYTSSVDGSTLNGDTFPRCVDNLTFDTDVDIVNGPVEIYVAGQVSIGNDVEINCPPGGCNTGSGDPDSTQLRVYSDGGDVSLGNHSEIAAGIYAPESDCGGNPSNAQGAIFGSMICGTIDNQGGWKFNYDDDLQQVGSNTWVLDDYREE
ncbi:hypothetical protein BH23ACT10_BH23ACT10_28860 [soil metagenome]